MDKLWENEAYAHRDRLRRGRLLEESHVTALVVFGIIEVASLGIALFVGSGIVRSPVMALVGILFITVFYYYIYRAEKKYREISASFGQFVQRSPLAILVFICAFPYYLVILYPFLNNLPAQYVNFIPLFLLILFLSGTFVLRPGSRMARDLIAPVRIESILEGLRNASKPAGMKFIVPTVFEGEQMKVANAFCAGILKPRIFISSYVTENLAKEETLAILLHEYGHARYHHVLKLFIPLVAIFIFLATIYTYVYLNPQYFFLQSFAVFALFFQYPVIFYKRRLELKADQFAAEIVGTERFISSLQKIVSLNLTGPARSSLSHPSFNARRKRLHRLEAMGKLKK